MRVIVKGKEQPCKLWNNPKIQPGIYRLMRYHIMDQCEEGTLLLNTVTGELVLLSAEEKELLDRLPAPYESMMDELIVHRFLVPDSFEDSRSVDQLRNLMKKLWAHREITSYSILPTTACNARCFYCFESDMPRYTMTPEMADKVVDYMITHCGESKKIGLKWFGGEPTLGEARIDQICDRLTEKGFSYTSSMISNAYLFTKEMARKAKEKWKLTFIQITLDGTEEIYNRTKAYVNAKGNPFQRVMDNIGFLLDEDVRVSVRMNLDKHNVDDLAALVDVLVNRFSGYKNFSAYAAPLFENCGFEPLTHKDNERDELVNAVVRLNQYIESKGCYGSSVFSQNGDCPSLKTNYCMANNPNSLQVNPLGEFSKCEHVLFDHLVGNINDGHDFDSIIGSYWLETSYKDTCKPCSLYPSCGMIEYCPSLPCTDLQMDEKVKEVQRQIQYRYRSGSDLIKKNEEEFKNDEQARV